MNKKKIIIVVALFVIAFVCMFGRDKVLFQLALNKAYYYEDRGEYEAALKEYDWMIEKEPDVYELYVNKGIILARLNRYDDALESFLLAEKITSSDAELYTNLAHLYNLMGKKEQEEDCINRAASLGFDGGN